MRNLKIKLIIALALGFISMGLPVLAQEKAPLIVDDIFLRYLRFADYGPRVTLAPHWMADGNSFWYTEGTMPNTVIYKVNPKENTNTLLFDTARLRQSFSKMPDQKLLSSGLPFSKFSFIDNEEAARFMVKDKEFILNLESYKIIQSQLPSKEERNKLTPRITRKSDGILPTLWEILSPDQQWFACIKKHNLWLRSTRDSTKIQLTKDGINEYEWGFLQGSETGPWAKWSPDNSMIAIKKVDSRPVKLIPNVDWLKPIPEVELVHFPYAHVGGSLRQSELYIVDVNSKRQVRMDTGMEKEQYIHIVGWCRNGSELLFLRLNRAFNKLDLMAADPLTGSSRIVLTDTQKTFIMGEQFSYKWPQICTLLEDGQRFLWMSEKNGWNHLYLYHINGNLLNRLNKGSYRVDQVITIDEAKGCVYFLAHPDQKRPYDTHLCKVNLNGEGFKQLTDATGYHWTQFAPSKEYFLDYHSNVDRPRKIDLRRADGTLLRTLAETDIMGLKELNWLPPEEFTVKAADGVTDLHGIIFKPFDFDPDKKYPIIENIYAGPQEAVVPHHFLGSSWWSDRNAVGAQALAQLGFIVYIVDGRGTVGRSKKFHDVVYGNFGTHEIPEHVGVLRQLGQNYPYMDLERVGLFGFSWGGYFTLRGMLLAPDVYHVGVAVSGLAEPVGNLVEPYLGLLPDNREEYKESSCLPLAGNLKGKLLLMVGTSDPLYSQNMKMVEALIQAGVPYDLNLFPGQGHDFVDHSRTYRNYLWITLGRYFQEHL